MIGMSPWVVHRDEDLYGRDAGLWRPERWLECDSEKRRKMEACLLTVCALSVRSLHLSVSRCLFAFMAILIEYAKVLTVC